MENKFCVVMVLHSFVQSWAWTRIAVLSFQHHFPNVKLLAVDHNNNAEELSFLEARGVTVITDPNPRHLHGDGLDCAAEWCRNQGFHFLIEIEPDCLILGRQWLTNLLRAVGKGPAMMAGCLRLSYGPIHICPSIWELSHIKSSFSPQLKLHDVEHSRFPELVYDKVLINYIKDAEDDIIRFLIYNWDTGFKNWFDLAVNDQTAIVANPDLIHYWGGSKSIPDIPNLNLPDYVNH